MSSHVIDTDNLTADQAAALVGQDKINAVEYVNCELTNNLRDDDLLEWSASVKAVVADGDDLGSIDWQIDHYRVR